MNQFWIDKISQKESLAKSEALTSEMLKKGVTYLQTKDEVDLKTTLYGEKNPLNREEKDRNEFSQIESIIKVNYYLKRTSNDK